MESKIQKKLIDILEQNDWYVVKVMKSNKNGISDLFAQKKGFKTLHIEVKKEDGKIDELQLYRFEEIIKKTDAIPIFYFPNHQKCFVEYCGFQYVIIRSVDDFLGFISTVVV